MNNKLLGLLLLSTLLSIACNDHSHGDKLPILGHREAVVKTVDGKQVVDTVYQTIPSFSFLNQDSVALSNEDFREAIYVADFFFTTCPSICPTMSRNLLKVLEKYEGNEAVKILSHTINPKYDTPSVLKKYATKLGVRGDQWQFAWGAQADIYKMADSYMVFAEENADVPGGFEHQGWFVLVDKESHIRGAYDGTDTEQVAHLLEDIDILLAEYDGQ